MQDVALNFEAAYLTQVAGSAEQLAAFDPNSIVPVIGFAPPFLPNNVCEGVFRTAVGDAAAEVRIAWIKERSQDPLRQLLGGISVGAVPNAPPLKFDDLSDHHGKLPFALVTILFFTRVANWLKQASDPEIYETTKVTGELPKEHDKIIAIRALNTILKSGDYPASGEQQFQYGDVTLFTEAYFNKGTSQPFLTRGVALAAQGALRTLVLRRSFGAKAAGVREAIASFVTPTFQTEGGLRDAVVKFLNDVLRHHVEHRRWIEAFWNEERKDQSGKRVPKEPKY